MSTPQWKRMAILVCGLLENLVFTGSILGWSALNYMLKQEGVYHYLCEAQPLPLNVPSGLPSFDTNSTLYLTTSNPSPLNWPPEEQVNATKLQSETISIGCTAQDRVLNLAFTVGTFFNGFTAFIWGFLLDKWGLRVVRLIINTFLTTGSVLLCFTNKDNSFIIFPAVIFLCLGGVPLRIANMQLANLFPKHRSTVITFYSGAFSSSAVVFVVLKYLFDGGMSFSRTCSLLVGLSLAMIPFTFLLLPADRVEEEDTPEATQKLIFSKKQYFQHNLVHVTPVTLEKYKTTSSPPPQRRGDQIVAPVVVTTVPLPLSSSLGGIKCNSETSLESKAAQVPLRASLFSPSFLLHQWWYSWLITYMIMYVGSMNLWLQRVTQDISTAGNFTQIYGMVQILSLVIAPVAGFLMDYQVNRADKETDSFKKREKRIRAGFWPMLFTTSTLSAVLVCRFFNNSIAIYASIVFITLLRSFLVAVASAYLRIRFPGEHFNKLLGIMSTCGAFVTLLQFPLFVWEAKDTQNALWVNLFNCFCTLLAYLNPLHIIVAPLQRYLLAKEVAAEEERPQRVSTK